MAPSPSRLPFEPLELVVEEPNVEGRVVGDDHRTFKELEEVGNHLLDTGRVGHHLLSDPRDVGDHWRYRPLRIYQGVEASHLPEAFEPDRPDLGDLARPRPRARGLEVEGHEGDVGQVGIGGLPVHERKQVAGGSRTEPPIVQDQDGKDFAADGFRSGGRGEKQTGGFHRIEWFSTYQQGLVESVRDRQRKLQLHRWPTTSRKRKDSLKRPDSSWTILPPWRDVARDDT